MKSRLITKKPLAGQKLKFTPMGKKPDVENAADAKLPGDAKEDTPKKKKINRFAKKAAMALAIKK